MIIKIYIKEPDVVVGTGEADLWGMVACVYIIQMLGRQRIPRASWLARPTVSLSSEFGERPHLND